MMLKKIRHTARLLLSAYLLVLFFIILPTHHHEDLCHDSDGCPLCYFVSHPGIVSVLEAPAVTLAFVSIVSMFTARIIFSKKPRVTFLRGPPDAI